MERVGGNAIDDFVLEKGRIDARVLQIEVPDAVLDVAVTGEDEVELGVLSGAPRVEDAPRAPRRARP